MGSTNKLSAEEVVKMLRAAGLDDCVEAATANGLTGEDLCLLTDNELKTELCWSEVQVSAVRKELNKVGGGGEEPVSTAEVKVDFMNPMIPKPSDESQKRRVFKSGKAVAPVPASQAALRDFDKLTKRIRQLESEEVETRVSREGAKLNSIQQYLQTETVVLKRLQDDGAKKVKAAEAAESGYYCGKLFAMCTGQHEAKVEERKKAVEAAKEAEAGKVAQLETATKDLAATEATLREMQAKVGELRGCRDSEIALVEGLFEQGTIRDGREQEMKRAYVELAPQLHQVREYQRTYGQADELLGNAGKQVADGMQFLRRAMGVNRVDQLGNFTTPGPGGGRPGANLVMEMAKKRNIAMAEELCNHAKANVVHAKTILPSIPNINMAEIKRLNFALQVVFDNVVTDAIAGRKIQANIRQMEAFGGQIAEAQRWVRGWLGGRINQDLQRLEAETQQSKAALDAYRTQLLAAEVAKL